ncbi:hypothetical protein RGQ15_13615 [Paracoccus sp. MBLB3053]|uniref:Uncharacterized protein n=1 Tax=Paracoccus aurantius TaxID=3073814 RepID=A0ABU2HV41_9RHOB|nr:hypothetical protein [Paracoccus sp. MBLB3053]MDS9467352.1 hypothetical protein [Paracoccus sp. MBLB3053]MDS9468602.1 hypothetical protein [Paracoccus sp. MBLB3053]
MLVLKIVAAMCFAAAAVLLIAGMIQGTNYVGSASLAATLGIFMIAFDRGLLFLKDVRKEVNKAQARPRPHDERKTTAFYESRNLSEHLPDSKEP